MPYRDQKVATTSTRWSQKLCSRSEELCGEWLHRCESADEVSRRLAFVRERIDELEQLAPESLVVPNETREELSELYAEAEYLEALAA